MTFDERSEETRVLEAALSGEERRQVVRFFQNSTEQVVSLDALVDELLDAERPPKYRERLTVRLHHVALPKLAEGGVVEYDARSSTGRNREICRIAQISSALGEREVAE